MVSRVSIRITVKVRVRFWVRLRREMPGRGIVQGELFQHAWDSSSCPGGTVPHMLDSGPPVGFFGTKPIRNLGFPNTPSQYSSANTELITVKCTKIHKIYVI